MFLKDLKRKMIPDCIVLTVKHGGWSGGVLEQIVLVGVGGDVHSARFY